MEWRTQSDYGFDYEYAYQDQEYAYQDQEYAYQDHEYAYQDHEYIIRAMNTKHNSIWLPCSKLHTRLVSVVDMS